VVKKSPSEVSALGRAAHLSTASRATARQGHVQCGESVPICHTSSGDAKKWKPWTAWIVQRQIRMRIHPFCPTVDNPVEYCIHLMRRPR
jgi:hypothetical protein